MTFLKIASLACASFVLSQGALGATGGTTQEPKAERVSCLGAMNHYRQLAKLSSFTEDAILSLEADSKDDAEKQAKSKSTFAGSVCTSLQSVEWKVSAPPRSDGTYAAHEQRGAKADCSAAVDDWQGAIVDFGSSPPKYNTEDAFYKNVRNLSFVALFNPKTDAKVDCAYITCPRTTSGGGNQESEAAEDGSSADPEDTPPTIPGQENNGNDGGPPQVPGSGFQEEEDSHHSQELEEVLQSGSVLRRLDEVRDAEQNGREDSHVLICVTTPSALEVNSAPFT
ncbi:hypothetical protein ACSSS7_001067 [Eimeria intestinalis]